MGDPPGQWEGCLMKWNIFEDLANNVIIKCIIISLKSIWRWEFSDEVGEFIVVADKSSQVRGYISPGIFR